jgi:hypothetical protein
MKQQPASCVAATSWFAIVMCVLCYGHGVASGGSLWGADFSGSVYEIDPFTGDERTVFEFPFGGDVPREINSLAFDPTRNRIVGVTGGQLFGNPLVLFQFNPFEPNPVPQILGEYQPTTNASYVSGLAFWRAPQNLIHVL